MIYLGLVGAGFDNLRGITVGLDDNYNNTTEMAHAVFEKLKIKYTECEMIDMGEGYPEFIINGKRYLMFPRIGSANGFPYQVIQLRILKTKKNNW